MYEFFLVLALFGPTLINCQAATFENKATLIEPDMYIMLWNSTRNDITVELRVKTIGFVGFGFSREGGMNGADVVVAWFSGNTLNFKDKHINGRLVEDDRSQDAQLLSSGLTDGITIVRFRRDINTCDTDGDLVLSNDLKVIFSYNQVPFTQTAYHGPNQRGSTSLRLFNEPIDSSCRRTNETKTNVTGTSNSLKAHFCLYFCNIIFLKLFF